MTLDLLFTVLMIAGAVYGYIYIGGVNNATSSELGAAFWPRLILGLMILLLIVNLVTIIVKKNGKAPITGKGVAAFFKSKLFIGMVICAATAFILPWLGFIPTCALFLVAYGILLGEKRPAVLALTAVVATLLLYIIFQGPLAIYLPRGVGFLRSFALAMEGLLALVGF